MQKSTHDLHALRAKVTQLLTLTLSSPSMTSFLNGKPNPMLPLAQAKGDIGTAKTVPKDDGLVPAGKRDRPADVHRDVELNPPGGTSATALAPADVQDDPAEQKLRPKAHQNAHNVIVEPSADDPDYVPPPFGNAAGAKKGKKKKKKSAMANAANPHHVKNCECALKLCILFSNVSQTYHLDAPSILRKRICRILLISYQCSSFPLRHGSSTRNLDNTKKRKKPNHGVANQLGPPLTAPTKNTSVVSANTTSFSARNKRWTRRSDDGKRC